LGFGWSEDDGLKQHPTAHWGRAFGGLLMIKIR
jgi:hypothetical protein